LYGAAGAFASAFAIELLFVMLMAGWLRREGLLALARRPDRTMRASAFELS